MVKIRLKRVGAKGAPVYRVVVANQTSPRDGRFIENLGFYNPSGKPELVRLNADRVIHWLSVGAVPTDTTRSQINGVRSSPSRARASNAARATTAACAPTGRRSWSLDTPRRFFSVKSPRTTCPAKIPPATSKNAPNTRGIKLAALARNWATRGICTVSNADARKRRKIAEALKKK